VDIPIHFLSRNAVAPRRAHGDDAAIDLHSVEAVSIPAGERAVVPTGLAIAIPAGYAGLVVPRAGLAAEHGITIVNSPGLIDPGYRGEIKVVLANSDPSRAFECKEGDRIAQLLVVPIAMVSLIESDELDETARGVGGFGSTGTS